ncbi:N-acyl amino acid synthase FeeM domain-containing protein [Magnetococcus sp. PR-3]|uniref:N-acyl amino acid synthase FeeM domain-containing protein n=1 Tax=Magnetococcus sp. PR-3 TaxID=3120355 RepID=UPI002FCE2ECF
MSIRTKLAETPEELHACYQLRHRVFAEGEFPFPPQPAHCFIDRFDAYGTSSLFMAMDETGEVVGTLRVSLDDPIVGLPADEFFDFRSHLTDSAPVKVGSASQLCVDPHHRGQLKVVNGLTMLTYYWAHRHDLSHVFCPFNPRLAKAMGRIGFHKIGEVVDAVNHHGVPIQPMMLKMADVRDSFIEFLHKQQIVHFMESFYREYFSAGEVVIQEGDTGEYAYFIVDGHAQVTLHQGDTNAEVLSDLGPGDLFGEIALLVDVKRTASVLATTDLEVMVMSRKQFLNSVEQDPKEAVFMLRTLGGRLAQLLSRL